MGFESLTGKFTLWFMSNKSQVWMDPYTEENERESDNLLSSHPGGRALTSDWTVNSFMRKFY